MLLTVLSCYKFNRCYIKLIFNILETVFVFNEILFKIVLFKGGVLIYAEHCIREQKVPISICDWAASRPPDFRHTDVWSAAVCVCVCVSSAGAVWYDHTPAEDPPQFQRPCQRSTEETFCWPHQNLQAHQWGMIHDTCMTHTRTSLNTWSPSFQSGPLAAWVTQLTSCR